MYGVWYGTMLFLQYPINSLVVDIKINIASFKSYMWSRSWATYIRLLPLQPADLRGCLTRGSTRKVVPKLN
jgi:hypothetical protein